MTEPKTIDSIAAQYVARKRKTIDPHEMRMAIAEAYFAGVESVKARPVLDLQGCGDGGCIVARPTGMHTNGGCHCEPRALRIAALALRAELDRVNANRGDEPETHE